MSELLHASNQLCTCPTFRPNLPLILSYQPYTICMPCSQILPRNLLLILIKRARLPAEILNREPCSHRVSLRLTHRIYQQKEIIQLTNRRLSTLVWSLGPIPLTHIRIHIPVTASASSLVNQKREITNPGQQLLMVTLLPFFSVSLASARVPPMRPALLTA
jgi:hypothetical protein